MSDVHLSVTFPDPEISVIEVITGPPGETGPAGGTAVAIGTTPITGGTSGRILYDAAGIVGQMTTSGSGTVVALATSPVLVTPTLGVALATSVNGNTITTGTGTLTLATFTLTVAGTASVSGTNTGDVANTALTTGTLAQFAATTSAQLAGIISDETGSGLLVFGTSPTLKDDVTVSKTGDTTKSIQLLTGSVRAVTVNETAAHGASYKHDSITFAQDAVISGNVAYTTLTASRTWTLPNQSGTFAMTSDITGTNSGTNTGDQTITLTGDVTGSGTGSFAATLATVPVAKGGTGLTALGTALQVLRVNAGATALEFGAASGGGSTNIFIGAAEMIPRTTAGCGVGSYETTTNDVCYDTLEFDTATEEGAQFVRVLPNNWNAGTVTAKFHWTAASGSGGVVFCLSGRSFADDDALDTAQGTAQQVADTLLAAGDMHISGATPAITIGGTPAAGTPVIFQIKRVVADGSDTLAVDALLLGVEITFS